MRNLIRKTRPYYVRSVRAVFTRFCKHALSLGYTPSKLLRSVFVYSSARVAVVRVRARTPKLRAEDEPLACGLIVIRIGAQQPAPP